MMKFIRYVFARDSYVFGTILGILSPMVFLFISFYIIRNLSDAFHFRYFDLRELSLFSLILNLVLIRIYLVNLKLTKTGNSIVAMTFLLMILHFVFNK